MKIVFTDLPTSGGKIQVSLDGGNIFKDYNVTDIKVSGIPLDNNRDYEKIRIKGPSNVLKSLDVISKLNIHSENDNGTFAGCNLTSLTIGNGVTSIGDYTFQGCSKHQIKTTLFTVFGSVQVNSSPKP